MRDLGRVPEGQRLVAGQPARQAAARLHRRVRLAALVEAHLDHPVGGAQRGLDVAVGEDALVRAIGRDRLVDPRQAGILGALGIDDGGERRVRRRRRARRRPRPGSGPRRSRRRRDRRRSGPCPSAGSASPSAGAPRSGGAIRSGAVSARQVVTGQHRRDARAPGARRRRRSGRSARGRAGCARRRRAAGRAR